MKKVQSGHVEYNPNQGFYLSVSWVLLNHDAAKDMLRDGLAHCARATHRDTPCVPFYFFRTSFDQREAKTMDETTKTLADHPHYTKVFKSIEMNVPLGSLEVKLKASNIDPFPLKQSPSTPLDANLKKQLGFSPFTISASEFYLDARSFVEHASSSDYLKAYGTVMEGRKSLKATTLCAGTPTKFVLEDILIAFLHANMAEETVLAFNQPKEASSATSPLAFLEFIMARADGWESTVKTLAASVNATVQAALKLNETEVRVEIGFSIPQDGVLPKALADISTISSGQMFAFSEGTCARPTGLPEQIRFHKMKSMGSDAKDPGSFFACAEDDESVMVAGYTLHPKSNAIVADETVEYVK